MTDDDALAPASGPPPSEEPTSSADRSRPAFIQAIKPSELHLSDEELAAISIRSPRLASPAVGEGEAPVSPGAQPPGGDSGPVSDEGRAGKVGELVGGRYTLERLLGEGAMASVYEAIDLKTGERVAVKMMLSAYAESPEMVARFRREAQAAMAVKSPHVVRVIDVGGDAANGLFLAMEKLRGEDLESLLQRVGRLAPRVACSIAAQAASGLAAAHGAGVVHRDIKPSNLFLSRRDDGTARVTIVDFGIAKPSDERQAEALTRVGSILGTPQYMAPEQALARAVGPGIDVFALGAVLFEMIAGRPAFLEQTSIQSTLVAVATQSVPRLSDVMDGVPPEVDELVHAMTLREASRRAGSMSEVLSKLSSLGARPEAPLRWADLEAGREARPALAEARPGDEPTPASPAASEPATRAPAPPGWLLPAASGLALVLALLVAAAYALR